LADPRVSWLWGRGRESMQTRFLPRRDMVKM